MPQSLARVYLHIVFSTKGRIPWLKDATLRSELYAYMATVLRDNVQSPAIKIGGVEDHVHVLLTLNRSFAIKDVVQHVKTETSKWIKRQPKGTTEFAWQAGYGAFSVSQTNVPKVIQYVGNQEKHHRQLSFQDEFRDFCKRHELEIDERYVWD
ncbi:transposase [Rhodopirellula europaea]|jgi:REP element-mobilizing transposase RayT|uniref:Transposase IS200-family protein n=1 Tax=Rhodopirellula europaea SH398 TaxID=1263868 RepID=M5S7G1_9BACT|nr:transposase [Rhodopirellula europaea]EMI27391.1 transposase IS200-family protein [Rhodopirellula europaea SH398]MCR9208458.1 transposase [bacterium]